jgi:glutathione S-transferase
VNQEEWRIYEHHLCPFCEKVRLAFAAKGIKYQNVQVDLGKKTQWHKDINGGLAPFLEKPDGSIIIESNVLMHYAQEKFPD